MYIYSELHRLSILQFRSRTSKNIHGTKTTLKAEERKKYPSMQRSLEKVRLRQQSVKLVGQSQKYYPQVWMKMFSGNTYMSGRFQVLRYRLGWFMKSSEAIRNCCTSQFLTSIMTTRCLRPSIKLKCTNVQIN